MKKNKILTQAQRQKRSTDKRKAAGLMHAKMWVHPTEVTQLRRYAAKLPLTRSIINKL